MRSVFCLLFFCFAISVSLSAQSASKVSSPNGGIKYGEKAVVSKSTNPMAVETYNNGYAAFKARDYKKAVSFYREAIALDPGYVDAYDNCGLAYRRLGNVDSAVYFYKASIKIYPKGSTAHGNLALLYSEKKEHDNALKEFDELAKCNPNDPEAPYGKAGVYLDMGKYDKALAAAKQSAVLFEKYHPQYAGDAYYYMGLSYFQLNDKANAKVYMQKAIDKGTKPPAPILSELGIK
ncbi:MAG: tetratricopeptide repeat protein [Bacteroidia bacterium]